MKKLLELDVKTKFLLNYFYTKVHTDLGVGMINSCFASVIFKYIQSAHVSCLNIIIFNC